jgi:hypothetical protein
MSGAIAVIIVLCLRHPQSHKGFLACPKTEAQQLLDLLQDVSTTPLCEEMLISIKQSAAGS